MRHDQVRRPLSAGAPHAIHTHTGHYRLADGSLLRVDFELDRFVGTLYTPGISVKSQIRGSAAEVHAWVDEIAAGYPSAAPHLSPGDNLR
jgi:hypothetical protein